MKIKTGIKGKIGQKPPDTKLMADVTKDPAGEPMDATTRVKSKKNLMMGKPGKPGLFVKDQLK